MMKLRNTQARQRQRVCKFQAIAKLQQPTCIKEMMAAAASITMLVALASLMTVTEHPSQGNDKEFASFQQ
jgi:hypothetical protein